MKAQKIEIDEILPKGTSRGPLRPGEDPLLAFLARLMDTQFSIPGTSIRFGLDPILGLLPGVGDSAGALISAGLILMSSRHGVPRIVLARMALNVLINSAVGAIPVIGDAFSVWFKSNARNYELLHRHAGRSNASTVTAKDWAFVAALVVGLLAIAILSFALALALGTRLFELLFKTSA